MKNFLKKAFSLIAVFLFSTPVFASEASLVVPDFKTDCFNYHLLLVGIGVAVIGAIFGLIEFLRVKKIPVHPVMEQVGTTIFETCKTYLVQQGKFLIVLEI